MSMGEGNMNRHLTTEELVDYNLGRLSPEEEHRVEKHLLSCTFCTEAMEGFSGMSSKQTLTEIMSDLHRKAIRRRTPSRRFFPLFDRISIIALVIILILLIFTVLYFARIGVK